MNKEETMQELQAEFARMGGKLDRHLENKMLAVEDIALEKYDKQHEQLEAENKHRPEWAKKAAEIAGKGIAWVSVAFTFVFILGGLFVGVILLLVAETIAVHDGFAVMDKTRAPLYAGAIISIYVVVLFIKEIVIDRNGERRPRKLSLRMLASDFWYFLGFGKKWIVQYKDIPDAAHHIHTTVSFSTWAIVSFGFLGRLDDKIAQYNDISWMESGKQILLESNLSDMIGYIGMIVATLALLWGTKWVVHFIYSNFKSVTGGVMVQDFSSASIIVLSPQEMIEAEKRKLIQREILKLKAKNNRE